MLVSNGWGLCAFQMLICWLRSWNFGFIRGLCSNLMICFRVVRRSARRNTDVMLSFVGYAFKDISGVLSVWDFYPEGRLTLSLHVGRKDVYAGCFGASSRC